MMVEGQFEVPEQQACKQHAGHAEADAVDFDFAERGTQCSRHPEKDDGAGY